jgi:hypothetical protein
MKPANISNTNKDNAIMLLPIVLNSSASPADILFPSVRVSVLAEVDMAPDNEPRDIPADTNKP